MQHIHDEHTIKTEPSEPEVHGEGAVHTEENSDTEYTLHSRVTPENPDVQRDEQDVPTV